MIPKEIVTKFSGPPGTGKSTTLLNVVDSLLSSGVDPESIAYTTFTRAGAYEARDRACARFGLPAQRLPYFKTLHSLCLSLLPSTEVMGPDDWNRIAAELGLFFSRSGAFLEEGISLTNTKGDVLLHLWSLSRLRMTSLDAEWERRPSYRGFEILRAELDRLVNTVAAYKKAYHKIDYSDMLEQWIDHGQDLLADYVIIDEAQDLSALQWKAVEKLCRHARGVWIAGDDDQCIYEWAGAAPGHFINLEAANYSVLPRSYRVPARVQRFAQKIIDRVSQRLPKKYEPRPEEGDVLRVDSPEICLEALKSGSWLLLGRSTVQLREYVALCRDAGLGYTGLGLDREHKEEVAAMKAARTWNCLARGETVTAGEAQHMYNYMSQVNRVKRGFKQPFMRVPKYKPVTHAILTAEHGLVAERDLRWAAALDMIALETMKYLSRVDPKGEFQEAPRIRILSIHASKGLEADHVMLHTDLPNSAFHAMENNPDPEHRLFYVGATRAKQTLTVISPSSTCCYSI